MEELKLIVLPLPDHENNNNNNNSSKFRLEKAVCNHGFFMMAPNQWIPSQKSLLRPLRIGNRTISLTFSISQSQNTTNYLLIKPQYHPKLVPITVTPQEREAIRCQVMRMLRVSAQDEKQLEEFHNIHPESKKKGFGRIFRSPTIFEDIVKSILLCNCPWKRSLEMSQALCDLQHKLSMRQLTKSSPCKLSLNNKNKKAFGQGNFPSSKELAGLDEETLNRHCNLGYRASVVLKLARDIENGNIKLDDLEHETDYDKLVSKLMKIKGFGPFTVANVMMCIGFYQQIPVDTETIKHLEEVHGKSTNIKKNKSASVVEEIYGKYAPYQCLVYWKERVEYYEKWLGKLSDLPKSQYCKVSTNNMEKKADLDTLFVEIN